MTATQLAEYKKIKAEPREARMEIDFLKKAAAFFAQESRQKHDTRTSTAKKATTQPV